MGIYALIISTTTFDIDTLPFSSIPWPITKS
jgi:hypothetical protein